MSDNENSEGMENEANAENVGNVGNAESTENIENTEAKEASEIMPGMEEILEVLSEEKLTAAEEFSKNLSSSDVNFDALLKVPVSLSIEVGRTKMPLNELLETKEGTVIELERLLDEPLDILVNGALVAHGVVVLANDRFGIQITDIISLQDRAQNL